jgi:hypothetical protein
MFISGIRVRGSEPNLLRVAWKRGGDRDFPAPQFNGGRVILPIDRKKMDIAVAEIIDRIRIEPGENVLTSLELLVAEDWEVQVGRSAGRGGPETAGRR